MTHEIPSWAASYIGIEYADRGRTREGGLDCWGLVRLVYAERFGVILPSFAESYTGREDRAGIAAAIVGTASGSDWAPADRPRLGDVLSFRVGRDEGHVGMVLGGLAGGGWMIHQLAGTRSCLERFDGRLWAPRLRGGYRYAGAVRLAGRPEAFHAARVDVQLPAGGTVEELLAAAGVADNPYLVVHIAGREVPREAWRHVRPKPGRIVTVAAVPRGGGGGGKTALRIVASIAVIAAAAWVGAEVTSLTTLAGSSSAAAYGTVTTAVLGIAGTLAVNALIPPPKPRLSIAGAGTETTSPTIAGGRNELRPYGVVPMVLGDYRWEPPYAARPFVEVQGDAQYLRCLFLLGEGPLAISEPKIGDTPLESYDGVEIEYKPGYLDDPPLSLFPAAVRQEDFSAALTAAVDWVSRVSAFGAAELSVDVTFPQGVVEFAADGTKHNRTVEIEVEYRRVGDAAFTRVNGSAGDTGSPTSYREMDFLFRTPEVELGGQGVHDNDLNWSASQVPYPDAKPAYLPDRGFSWMVFGYVYAPVTGQYQFCVDSNDAADVHVDGHEVASFYGAHPTEVTQATLNSTTHAGNPITLRKGWHGFRARVECRTATHGALAVGWKKPGDGAFTIVPQSNFSRQPDEAGAWMNSLQYRWYVTGRYVSEITVTEARSGEIRRSLSWATPDQSPTTQYEVRLRRVTPDSTSAQIFDASFWTALRTVTTEDPLPKPGLAAVALRIKATDQLNGVLDTFSVRTRSLIDDYDAAGGVWIQRASSNPAACLKRIYNGPPSSPLLGDARLDLAELAAFHAECEVRGLQFNGVIDFAGTVLERAADVAAAGRGTPGMRDGLFSVVRDRPQTVPVQHFTPANSRGFRGQKSFPDRPHALRVQFMNAAVGYQQDERLVPDDDHTIDGRDAFGNLRPDLTEATRFETLEVFGCTSMTEAFRHGRYHLAVATLRPELYTLETDVEHLVCNRGDLVLVTHDVPLWGNAWGRVTGLVTDSGDRLLKIRTDNELLMETGFLYRIRVRLGDGTSWLRDLVTTPGLTHELTLAVPEPASSPRPVVGDLFMYGPPGLESRELLVKAIEIDRDLGATLQLVDHAPAVHLASDGEIPDYDSGITRQGDDLLTPEDPVITSIRSDDLVMIRDADGSLRNRMLISLRAQSGTRPIATQAQVRTRPKPPDGSSQASWTAHPTVPIDANQVSVTEVDQGVTYQIRLRTLTLDGRASNWVAAEHTIVGKTFPPPDVAAFDVVRLSDGTRRYSWDLGVVPPDIAGVVIRYGLPGTLWEAMTPLHTGVLQSSPSDLNVPPAGTWRFGIKAIDTSGNVSLNPLYIDRTLGEERLEGVAFSSDEGIAGWPGAKTNCHVANQTLPPSLLEPDDDATWSTLAAHGALSWSSWPRWILAPKTPIRYESAALDAGFIFDFSPDAIVAATGTVLVEAATSVDGSAWSAWTEISVARQTSVNARYVKVRVTAGQSATVTVPLITRLVVLMRAEVTVLELNDVDTAALPAGLVIGVGDVRLPVTPGRFSVIRSVSVTFNGMGPGWSWEQVDRDTALGPRVRLYNDLHALSHATLDATIRGL